MNRILKRATVLGVGVSMLMVGFLPMSKASAIVNDTDKPNLIEVQMRKATGVNTTNGMVFTYNNGTVTVTGNQNTTLDYELNENHDYGPDGQGGNIIAPLYTLWTSSTDLTFTLSPSQNYDSYVIENGNRTKLNGNTYSLSNLQTRTNNPYGYMAEFEFTASNTSEDPVQQDGNTEATIRLRGVNGSYTRNKYDENHNIVDTTTGYYKETYTEASVSINNSNFWRAPETAPNQAVPEYAEIADYRYNVENNATTVDITVNTLWNWRLLDAVIINGTSYPVANYLDYNEQVSYLTHYDHQVIGFTINGVAKAATYDITVKVEEGPEDAHDFIGNFLWTADPEQQYERDCHDENGQEVCEIRRDANGDPVPGRDYIGNSSLKLIEVLYTVGNTTYNCNVDTGICRWWDGNDEEHATTCNIADANCGVPFVEFDAGRKVRDGKEYDDGSLVIPAGARVTMRVVPDYGYQVMNVNMSGLTTSDDGVGEFTFTVPEGAAYFVADVVPTEDVVNTKTNIVTGGSINLGDNQTTLNHGSARLDINSVNLSEENIAAFENAAGGAGDYKIKNYLDISLYNVTCKGAATCTGSDEDSWNERVRDLNEPATITIQLEEGVDGNDIVIVHEKHDGTYEIIETTYDPETHTITFTTSSFSNYAIASRTVVAPDTGAFYRDGFSGSVAVKLASLTASVLVAMWIFVKIDKKIRA